MKRLVPALLALSLVACGQSGADSTVTSATPPSTVAPVPTTAVTPTEPTQAPTSTSTAPTSPTAPTSTTAPSTEIVSPSGFWEVRVGETLAENEARIGFPFESGADPDPTTCVVVSLPEAGGIYFIATAPGTEPVSDRSDLIVGRVTATAPLWATADGTAVEMAVEEVQAVLGDAIVDRQPHTYLEDGEYLFVGPADDRYVYETDGRVITAIHAGLEPVVSYVEACS